jgi:hypothetical protein
MGARFASDKPDYRQNTANPIFELSSGGIGFREYRGNSSGRPVWLTSLLLEKLTQCANGQSVTSV